VRRETAVLACASSSTKSRGAFSRSPKTSSAVVVRRGLTVRQTEALIDDALDQPDSAACAALLARRLDDPVIGISPGPRAATSTG